MHLILKCTYKERNDMFDMKNLTLLKNLDENAPEAMQAFWAFDKATFKAGAIDELHKQLMAVAVALTTQCPYCIELHLRAARKAGATDAMLAETATVAAAMRAGAAVTHASHLFKG
jgi:AhpD family alkylhydroperoxidase